MEAIMFDDPNVRPDEALIFSCIKECTPLWKQLFESIHTSYPDVTQEWNFYNDGKRWLMKTMKKKKNLFWTCIHADSFRITFYFADKAEPLLEKASLPVSLLDEFRNGKYYGKIRGLSIKVQTPDDIENILKLTYVRVKI